MQSVVSFVGYACKLDLAAYVRSVIIEYLVVIRVIAKMLNI